jgi:hypothetical protein
MPPSLASENKVTETRKQQPARRQQGTGHGGVSTCSKSSFAMDLNVLAIRDNRNSRAEGQPSGKVRLKAVKTNHCHSSLQKACDSKSIKYKLTKPASVMRSRRGQRRYEARTCVDEGGDYGRRLRRLLYLARGVSRACARHLNAEILTSAQKREKLQFSSAWPMAKMLACSKEGGGGGQPSVRA